MTEWKLTPEEEEFLFDESSQKFLTEFTVGTNKFSIYGSPAFMATKSNLIKTYLKTMSESKAPYEVITFMEVNQKAFITVWLYINGFGLLWGRLKSLNFIEFVQTLDIINYFDLGFEFDQSEWAAIFGDMTEKLSKEELDKYSELIVDKLNKLFKLKHDYGFEYFLHYLREKGATQILDKLDYVLLASILPSGTFSPNSIFERKILNDEAQLDKFLEEEYNMTKIGPKIYRQYGNMNRLEFEPNAVISYEIQFI